MASFSSATSSASAQTIISIRATPAPTASPELLNQQQTGGIFLSEEAAWGLGLAVGVSAGAIVMVVLGLIIYKCFLEEEDSDSDTNSAVEEEEKEKNAAAPTSSQNGGLSESGLVMGDSSQNPLSPLGGFVPRDLSKSGGHWGPRYSAVNSTGSPNSRSSLVLGEGSVNNPGMHSSRRNPGDGEYDDDIEEMEDYEEEVEELIEVRASGSVRDDDDELDMTTIMIKKKVTRRRPRQQNDSTNKTSEAQKNNDAKMRSAVSGVNAANAFKEAPTKKKKKRTGPEWRH